MKKNHLLLIGLMVVVIAARYAIGNYEYSREGGVTEVFVIRSSGSLFMDFNIKLFFAIATVILIVYDWRTKDRLDYFWVGLTGTLIAVILEALAILSGERQFQVNYLFGIELPFLVDLLLRAIAEFAFYAVLFLFFADRMLKKETRKNWMIALAIVTIVLSGGSFAYGIQAPNYGGEVASRRAMTGTGSLILMGIIAYGAIAFFLTKPKSEGGRASRYLRIKPTDEDRRRGLYLLVLLTIYFSVGQIAEYLAGARWIEIGAVGSIQHADPLIEFLGLTYNALVEGAVFYMPYYTIPLGLKLVESIETKSNIKTA